MDVSCSQAQLEGFAAACRLKSISSAARELRITQPTLSLRLKALEESFQCRLFRRGKKGLVLTPEGERLFAYVQIKEELDQEYLSSLSNCSDRRAGTITVGGHFSIVHHVAVPVLAPFLRSNPGCQIHTVVREDDELPLLIDSGACDFFLLQAPHTDDSYVSEYLGREQYVLVESSKFKTRNNVFLDSDLSDSMTADFLATQPRKLRPSTYSRSFLANEAGIFRAVAQGIGRAVVARSEISGNGEVRICRGFKPYGLPSYLCYQRRRFYSKLHHLVLPILLDGCRKLLADS
jgi:DNA-binding transcriptional LysR family regulator